jgi:hypothetical protein
MFQSTSGKWQKIEWSLLPIVEANMLVVFYAFTQSSTQNIFVVTSEWDTQIGKQLRMMDSLDDEHEDHLFRSRIFSTEVGMRPAEPCSISVVATHQLLTNLLEYICVVVLSDDRFRRVTCSHITEEHLLVLEKCNQMNIEALSEIVGVNEHGVTLHHKAARTEAELRAAGDVWADHILEVARAYMMTFVYIFVTVISQFPLFYAIAFAAGLDKSNPWIYVSKFRCTVVNNSYVSCNCSCSYFSSLLFSSYSGCRGIFLAASNQYNYIATNSRTKPIA